MSGHRSGWLVPRSVRAIRLLFVCRTVYEQGRTNGISAPIFYKSYEEARSKAARHDQYLPGMGHERKETT